MAARYVVGIDLGTTNCVLAYAALDLDAERPEVQLLRVPQLVAPATVESDTSLPSFAYLASEHEAIGGALDLPWTHERNFAVGRYARGKAAEAPERAIGAAKSWLAHSRVDRRQPILPWNCAQECGKDLPRHRIPAVSGALGSGLGLSVSGIATGPTASRADRAGVVRRGGSRVDA